ncbi:MAG: hypothetical protein R3F56_00665 [Planctomycetota bacterium]
MRRGLVAAALLAACPPAQNLAECVRSNEPYYVLSATRHPVTGFERAYPASVPAGYVPGGGGVATDTYRFKVFPGDVFRRAQGRQISGFHYVARNSSATATRNTASYLFQFDLRPTVARSGGGLDPDFTQSMLSVASQAGGGQTNTYHVFASFSPVALTFNDCAISLRYRGGENDDKDANAGQGPSQCTASSWLDGVMPYVPDGDWRNGTFTYNTDPNYQLWVTFSEVDPVCNVWSNWGRQRDVPRVPPLKGHSLGTYFSDLISGSPPYEFGFDVDGGSANPNRIVVPLLNLGPVQRTGLPFQGVTLEVNVADPALTLLHGVPGFVGSTNGVGRFATPAVPFRSRLFARGLYLGVECVLFDTAFNTVGSTGAQWVLIN